MPALAKAKITLADLRLAQHRTKNGQTNPLLYCSKCGALNSAHPEDYFNTDDDYVFRCCGGPMRLVRKITTFEDVAL